MLAKLGPQDWSEIRSLLIAAKGGDPLKQWQKPLYESEQAQRIGFNLNPEKGLKVLKQFYQIEFKVQRCSNERFQIQQ